MAALKALLAHGFVVPDLCVSATIDTVSMAGFMLQNSANIDSALLALFLDVEPCQTIGGLLTIVGSRGNLLATLNGLISQCQKEDTDHPCDDCRKISSELVAHIEQGQLVLVVDVDEPQRLISACQILLKFSPHVIQTREFLLA